MAYSVRYAEALDAQARADQLPTPREAMAVLLRRDADDYARLEAERDAVYERLRARALRANYELDAHGRGLPERHPDRFSLNDLVTVTGKHRTTINHWLEELKYGRPGKPDTARPDLLPTYKLPTDQDAAAGTPA